ncbi:MAG: agmatinase [Myxococcota bacterium]|nr:agmatinase [Myxococcota bacterium]
MSGSLDHVALISLPFEATTSFLTGTVAGPEAILREITSLDGYDLAMGRNPWQGVAVKKMLAHDERLKDPHGLIAAAYRSGRSVLEENGFPLGLGGEHTVSIGMIKAARAKGPLGIVQLDAHADLRDTYEGNPYSHACAMRRSIAFDCPLMGIGIRAISKEEMQVAAERSDIVLVHGRAATTSTGWFSHLNELPDRVYLTIDLDAFDPSCVSAVGTPEPGGMSYENVLNFLRVLFQKKNVVAADVVELRPGDGDAPSLRLVARLVGAIVGLCFNGST